MGSKKDGFKSEKLICRKEICMGSEISDNHLHFLTEGQMAYSWCVNCGHYYYTGKIDGLIAFWMGDLEATNNIKGYYPKWFKDIKGTIVIQDPEITDIELFLKAFDLILGKLQKVVNLESVEEMRNELFPIINLIQKSKEMGVKQ